MKKYSKNKDKKSLPVVLLLVAILVLAGVASGGYVLVARHKKDPTNTINFNPPTKQEKASGNQQKQADIERQQVDTTSPSQTSSAVLHIVDASQYQDQIEVRGYTGDVYEDGGTCTATFTKDSKTVTGTSKAFKDATTTQCTPIDIPRSNFPSAGVWNLVVSYSSTNNKGTSEPQQVTIN